MLPIKPFRIQQQLPEQQPLKKRGSVLFGAGQPAFSVINKMAARREELIRKLEAFQAAVDAGQVSVNSDIKIEGGLDRFAYGVELLVNGDVWSLSRYGDFNDQESDFGLLKTTEVATLKAPSPLPQKGALTQKGLLKGLVQRYLPDFLLTRLPDQWKTGLSLSALIQEEGQPRYVYEELSLSHAHYGKGILYSWSSGSWRYRNHGPSLWCPLEDITVRNKALRLFQSLETQVLKITKEDYRIVAPLEDQLQAQPTANALQLSAAVEAIELKLRALVCQTLSDEVALLPPHVLTRVNERIERAVEKAATTVDVRHYETLGGKLEYADLRELQDIIASKALWQKFQEMFGNKETLFRRFDQLGELRNVLRHSRTLDEVVVKEGEAALIWFERLTK